MIHSGFFKDIKQKTIRFKKFKAKSPMFFYDAHMMAGIFLADYRAVKKILPDSLKPIRIFTKKALLAIHCIEYLNTDVGPYNEVSFSIILKSPGSIIPGSAKTILDLLTKKYHAFIEELPVTTEISRAGGVQFLKFPKFLADISFRETATHRICTLRDKKTLQLIMEFDLKKFKTVSLEPGKSQDVYTIHTYSQKKTTGLRGRFKVNLIDRGFSFLLPHISLRWGQHKIAKKIKSLKPGLLLQTILAPECEAVLFANE